MSEPITNALAALPSVDRLLNSKTAARLIEEHGRQAVTNAVRAALDDARAKLRTGEAFDPDQESLLAVAGGRLGSQARAPLVRVFNLTGTVLHTNLGRALLPARGD